MQRLLEGVGGCNAGDKVFRSEDNGRTDVISNVTANIEVRVYAKDVRDVLDVVFNAD